MKKLLIGICAALACVAVSAQEAENAEAQQAKAATEQPAGRVFLAFRSTKNIDVVGLRLTVPYCEGESVTGCDLGFIGHCRYFEGFQLNLLRNDAKDILAGFQVGLYNSAGHADMLGIQVGLWNEARSFRGAQVGLVNITDAGAGIQLGLINRAESFSGYQGGVVNVIRESECAFLPILNVGF